LNDRLQLTREQILRHRRAAGALDEKLPPARDSLRIATWAGLQDSMPKAALLSIHARVEGTGPTTWEDPSLVQVWGPRFQDYVISVEDLAVFTLARLPEDENGLKRANEAASRLHEFLEGRRMSYGEAGRAIGVNPNSLRYGTTTGRILIRWEGARSPIVWTVPQPEIDPFEARLEMVRRYLRVFGPGTADGFAKWAGMKSPLAQKAFDALEPTLIPARSPIGDAWILAEDEGSFQAKAVPAAPARLLPSGDTYFLSWGAERELLVPDAKERSRLWTSRVWPGAVLVGGEIVGTWRRDGGNVAIEPWHGLTAKERQAIEAEATSFPLPGLAGQIRIRWSA
jgi:Winged helix DNA-binding domain